MAHRIKRYHMDFEGKGLATASVLMGFAFFLRVVYYFGFTSTETVGISELVLFLILPLVLEAGLIALLRGVRLNMSLVYGILGAVYCAVLIAQSLQYGSILRMVLGIIAYVLCGGLLVVVSLGLLSKGIAVMMCVITAVVRLAVFDLKPYLLELNLVAFLPEAAAICVIFALGYMAMGLKEQ